MNRHHLQALLWLRWRLRLNQLKRDGVVSMVVLAILAVLVAGGAVGLFIMMFLTGWLEMGEASPLIVLIVWDVLLFLFLLFWCIGLLIDLQRSDVLSLDKFLHLPVSLTGAFVINYLGTLFSVGLLMFLAATVGLSLGLCLAKGPAMLLLLPLTAAFVLMVTALTYQFQGWLAALMVNKRRRRTVIVVVTLAFMVVCQAPNVVFNVYRPYEGPTQIHAELQARQAELERAYVAKEVTDEEFQARHGEIWKDSQARTAEWKRQNKERWLYGVWLANLLLPPGWLPLGAQAVAEGHAGQAVLCVMGLALIGTASLWRSYRTTLRLYTGYYTSKPGRTKPQRATNQTDRSRTALLERKLPGASEPVSAIAVSCWISLWRSPEVKLLLAMPLLLVLIFGSMAYANASEGPPGWVRPFLAPGAMMMTMLSLSNLVGNQFGLDRGGFRAFVLGPVARRDILVGKNLAVAPLAIGIGLAFAVGFQLAYPSPLDYFLSLPFVFVSMFLASCLVANLLSIVAPLGLRSGMLRPVKMSGLAYVLHMGFALLLPVVMGPMLLPVVVAVGIAEWRGATGWPICLPLAVVECAAVVCLYRLAVRAEGAFLQKREQKILAVVAIKEE